MAARLHKRGSTKGLLSVLAFLGLAMLVVPFILKPHAYLYLDVSDGVFQDSDLDGRKGEIVSSENGQSLAYVTRKSNGRYTAMVGKIISGKSKWRILLDGYYPQDLSVDAPPLSREFVQVSMKPKFGRLKIIPVNGIDKAAPVDSEVNLRVNDATKVSGTASEGILVSFLSPGGNEVIAESSGYYPSGICKVSVTEGKTVDAEIVLIPKLKEDEVARIVLRWDKKPDDLDSHLFLPRNQSLKNRHVYFPAYNKKSNLGNDIVAKLDLDDTSSYGPETITIYNTLDGRYRYAVYHYSGSGSLGGTSKAEVTVYTHNNEIKNYSISQNCKSKWWYVFDLNITSRSVEIITKNQCPQTFKWRTGSKRE